MSAHAATRRHLPLPTPTRFGMLHESPVGAIETLDQFTYMRNWLTGTAVSLETAPPPDPTARISSMSRAAQLRVELAVRVRASARVLADAVNIPVSRVSCLLKYDLASCKIVRRDGIYEFAITQSAQSAEPAEPAEPGIASIPAVDAVDQPMPSLQVSLFDDLTPVPV